MKNQIVTGNIRIQFLSENIIRAEYSKNGVFEDRNTLFIPNRAAFGGFSDYSEKKAGEGKEIDLCGYTLHIPANAKSLKGLMLLSASGEVLYSYKPQKNSGELPLLDKTPEVFALSDNPRITVPEHGYSYAGDISLNGFSVDESAQDIYLLLCKKDFKLLRSLYVELTGRGELVRLSTLGVWNSKYYAYSQKEAEQVILDYEKYNVPLDNIVIDTDWRKASDRGIGYDIDTKLFPDMKGFFDFAHEHGVEVMFNDHPEPVDGAESILNPAEVKFREEKLQGLMELGLDYWWYDRNWHTKLKSPSAYVEPETMGLYAFADITENFYKKQAGGNKIHRRPVIMGNVNNVLNGEYVAINDSASHRYSVQWTGDIMCGEDSLSNEAAVMIKTGNNCIGYTNADCGGHIGNPDAELYTKWVAFGVLSPVFRPHCTKIVERYREPWVYGEEVLYTVREYINMRYRLLPVIYTAAHSNYETGQPIFKSLAYNYPEDKKVYGIYNEYMLGNNILAACGVKPQIETMQRKHYVSAVKASYFNGRECKGDPIWEHEYSVLDEKWNHTSPSASVPVYNFSAIFETDVKFDKDVHLIVESDDGVTVYVDGELTLEDKQLHGALKQNAGFLSAGKVHHLKIYYFQADGEACISLKYKLVDEKNDGKVYLPAGNWIDAFGGKIFSGSKTYKNNYKNGFAPLYIRQGALIPLAFNAKNTKEQKWDKLVYDFYPSYEASDSGYIYEDDGETTAYKYGQYRKSGYSCGYDPIRNCMFVKLDASLGTFKGARCYKKRKALIRFNCLKGISEVEKVTVNGVDTAFKKCARKKTVFPFATEKSRLCKSITVSLKQSLSEEYLIEFHLK